MLNFGLIQSITGGHWLQEPTLEQPLFGGSFDTRTLKDEHIFLAFSGEHVDGHNFLPQLKNSAVRLAIVEKAVQPNLKGLAVLQVDNSLKALHQMAGFLRQQFTGKVIALTGSSGKTTFKNWLAYVLRQHMPVLSTKGNFNNHLGCPISLLDLQPEQRIVLLEIGASGVGEIDQITQWLQPDYSLLLNVGHAHLGKFGSLKNTYQAKQEIFNHLKKGGRAFAPANDKRLNQLPQHTIYFGKGSANFGWRVNWDNLGDQQMLQYQFLLPDGAKNCWCNQIGAEAGQNLSLLVALCLELGLSWQQISHSLTQLPTSPGRLQLKTGLFGAKILDDSYNANPESLVYLWQTMSHFKGFYKISVVGELTELEAGLKESSQIIQQIPAEIDQLFLSGHTALAIKHAVLQQRPNLKVQLFEDFETLLQTLQPFLNANSLIGIKGSRAAGMERLVQLLLP